jgi:soluble lytic murein transglycosylase-like protein
MGLVPHNRRAAQFAVALLLAAPAQSAPRLAHPWERECRSLGADAAYDTAVEAAVVDVASVWPLPAALIRAIIRQESAFRPSARSSAGAIGLMQVLPSNAWRLGFAPQALWNPANNILAGTRLLAVLLKHYQGDVISALVAYNARPRRPLAATPDNGETLAYVRAVLHLWAICEKRGAPHPGVASGNAEAPRLSPYPGLESRHRQ